MKKNSIYSLCQNSTPIVCHLNVQGILWSNIWMYVIVCLIFFYWKTILITGHVSFDLSKLFYCLRQVLIHFVLNICFPSNHILQIILAFQREKCPGCVEYWRNESCWVIAWIYCWISETLNERKTCVYIMHVFIRIWIKEANTMLLLLFLEI